MGRDGTGTGERHTVTSHDPSIDRYAPLYPIKSRERDPSHCLHTRHDPTLPSHGPTPGTRAPIIPSPTPPSLDFDWVDERFGIRGRRTTSKKYPSRMACANEWARDEWGGVMMTT